MSKVTRSSSHVLSSEEDAAAVSADVWDEESVGSLQVRADWKSGGGEGEEDGGGCWRRGGVCVDA